MTKSSISITKRFVIIAFLCTAVGFYTSVFDALDILSISSRPVKISSLLRKVSIEAHSEDQELILVVGLPKAGTTSLYHYFEQGGYKTSHWRCRTHEELCGALIRENVQNERPPLENTGDYQVYTQLDGDCYFPQISALEQIHKYYPHAKLILNLRNVDNWIHSMQTFQAGYFEILPEYQHKTLCDISEKDSTIEEYTTYFNAQTKRIQEFVKRYPSHQLITINIDDSTTGDALEQAFGISKDYWGQENKGQNEVAQDNAQIQSDSNMQDSTQQIQTEESQPTLVSPETTPQFKKPIMVVGMPKGGTTTMAEYFECGNLKTSHWRCSEEDLCGAMIRRNIQNNRPPLENTGDYDVYAQLDGDCFFPQIEALDVLHQYYPDSTWILNLRDAASWTKSVKNFVPDEGALTKYGMPKSCTEPRSDEIMIEDYENHTKRIKEFVKMHPSHQLVEFRIEDPLAGAILEDAFGIPQSCWGKANVNAEIH